MQHAKALLFTIAVMTALSGCSPSYRETLEQKMDGKSTADKRALLAQECGQEIRKGLKPEDESNVRHFEKMKKICEEMTGQKVDVALPPSDKP